MAAITIALFIFTRCWCTPTHVQSKPSSDFTTWFQNYGTCTISCMRRLFRWNASRSTFCFST